MKIKAAILTVIFATLILFVCIGATWVGYAETDDTVISTEQTEEPPADSENPPVSPDGDIGDAEPASGINNIVAQFTEYLKQKYGADYEFYYNQIIEQWGSIENYLLAFGNKLPEQYQTGWDKFVGWLNDYAPVWAVPLAVAIVIIVAVVGKKAFNKAIDRIVNVKLSPIIKELNTQSSATVSLLHAQKALLGNVSRFKETVDELDEAEKELKDG